MPERTPEAARYRPIKEVSASMLYRPLARSLALVLLVFVVGVVGYQVIGGARYTLVDAIYMTTITLTTVGYSEVIDLSHSPAGRLFTTGLLLGGVGSFVYFVSNLTAFLVEGNVHLLLWRKRMSNAIRRLDGHAIVCGGGYTGAHILHELRATGRPFVLIESDPQRVADLIAQEDGVEFPVVVGDATDDDVLLAAGIERASGLVSCISNDKDNLIVTVSARLLNGSLRIVCRCVDEKVVSKIRKAGADAVVSPNRIGGLRMISELVRPTAVSFLDQMLRGPRALRVESTPVAAGSALAGTTIGELQGRRIRDLLIVAIERGPDDWDYHPADAARLEPGSSLVTICSPSGREALEALCRGTDARA